MCFTAQVSPAASTTSYKIEYGAEIGGGFISHQLEIQKLDKNSPRAHFWKNQELQKDKPIQIGVPWTEKQNNVGACIRHHYF